MRKLLMLLILLFISLTPATPAFDGSTSGEVKSMCQCSQLESAGTDMPYPTPNVLVKETHCPQGYHPIYICHVGSHGCRKPENPALFDNLLEQLSDVNKLGKLTPRGKSLLATLTKLKSELTGHWGELTTTGVMEIATYTQRLLGRCSMLFAHEENHNKIIECIAAPTPRCIHSMNVFLTSVKANYKDIFIRKGYEKENLKILEFYNLNNNYQRYLSKGNWRNKYNKHKVEKLKPMRFTEQFFQNDLRLSPETQCNFMLNVFSLRNMVLGMDEFPDFDVYFTDQELNDLWQITNYRDYLARAGSGEENFIAMKVASPLLMEMITSSDRALYSQKIIGNFRFAYPETLIPLIALMGIPEGNALESNPYQLCRYWRNFNIAPMAGNLQWIFYGNKQGEVLVKILLNEEETTLPLESEIKPYYEWNKVKKYYSEQLIRILPTIGYN